METKLRVLHRNYRRDRKAWVAAAHPEARVLPDKGLTFVSKGPPDFIGVLDGGQMVCFDAKETGKSSLPFKNVKIHQARDLTAIAERGGLAFLVVHWKRQNVYGLVMWEDISDEFWEWIGTDESSGIKASISHSDPRVTRLEGADWLPIFESRACEAA